MDPLYRMLANQLDSERHPNGEYQGGRGMNGPISRLIEATALFMFAPAIALEEASGEEDDPA